MLEGIKLFIEENIDLIETGDYELLYVKALANVNVPKLTEVLLQAGIDPLKNVTRIPAHYLCETDIKEFTVPSHIRTIGYAAFWNCEILNKVTLPEGLTFISEDAFAECHNLWQINLPSTLEEIMEDAFAETNLHHVVIPDLVKKIPRHCFENCEQLETVKLGKFCNSVGERAFAECSKMHFIQLNEGLKTIGPYAFSECYALKAIYIPESVIKISRSPFYKIEDKINIICIKNSYTHKWCEENNQKYRFI